MAFSDRCDYKSTPHMKHTPFLSNPTACANARPSTLRGLGVFAGLSSCGADSGATGFGKLPVAHAQTELMLRDICRLKGQEENSLHASD